MPVLRNAVRSDALVDRPEEKRILDRVTRAADAGLAVDDDLVADEPIPQRRQEREERGHRIAARIRDQAGAPDLGARDLGHAVDGLAEEIRSGMGVAIPALVELRVAKPEVAHDVDDDAPLVKPRRRLARRLAGRQRGEHDLGIAEVAADAERVGCRVQMRLHRAQRLALTRARYRGDELRLGMAQDQTRELPARVPCRSHDRHGRRHPWNYAVEWIIMQTAEF